MQKQFGLSYLEFSPLFPFVWAIALHVSYFPSLKFYALYSYITYDYASKYMQNIHS